MSLRYICIEVRQNLRCANVFLQFDHSLTETEFLKILVEDDALTFREYSTATYVPLHKFFTAEARTISNLTVEECNASFRLTMKEYDHAIDPAGAEKLNKATAAIFKPNVEEGTKVRILCNNCKCELTPHQLDCQRVREFPSGSIDMSEFFCHHGPKFDELLVPQLNDLFYGFQFIVLNMKLLKDQIKGKDKHVYCGRCLQYFGEMILNDKAVKLWADTLLLQKPMADVLKIFNDAEWTPTYQLLYKIIDDTQVSGGSVDAAAHLLQQQLHFCKVLLDSTFPNRERKYLLLQVLEKQLEVLRNSKPLAHGGHNNNNNILQVELQRYKCFKLLYRPLDETDDEGGGGGAADGDAGSTCSSTNSDAMLLKSWKEDMSIHVIKVSPTLFDMLLEELDENSLLLPELYRYTHDHFQLSYIFYKD